MQTSTEDRRQVTLAGALLFVATTLLIFAITIAQGLIPGYSVSNEAISGLGLPYFSSICSKVPDCLTPIQPASAIFVFAVFLYAVLLFWSGLLLRRGSNHRTFGLAFVVSAVAAILVGISYLPFYLGATSAATADAALVLHYAGASLFFTVPASAAISAYRFIQSPLRHFSLILGAISLGATLVTFTGSTLGLGFGEIQRMAIYPVLLWEVGFGTYLLRGLE